MHVVVCSSIQSRAFLFDADNTLRHKTEGCRALS